MPCGGEGALDDGAQCRQVPSEVGGDGERCGGGDGADDDQGELLTGAELGRGPGGGVAEHHVGVQAVPQLGGDLAVAVRGYLAAHHPPHRAANSSSTRRCPGSSRSASPRVHVLNAPGDMGESDAVRVLTGRTALRRSVGVGGGPVGAPSRRCAAGRRSPLSSQVDDVPPGWRRVGVPLGGRSVEVRGTGRLLRVGVVAGGSWRAPRTALTIAESMAAPALSARRGLTAAFRP